MSKVMVIGCLGAVPPDALADPRLAEATLLVGADRYLSTVDSQIEKLVLGDVTAAVGRLAPHGGAAGGVARGEPGRLVGRRGLGGGGSGRCAGPGSCGGYRPGRRRGRGRSAGAGCPATTRWWCPRTEVRHIPLRTEVRHIPPRAGVR